MKYILILLVLVSCGTSITVTKINDFEFYISGDTIGYARHDLLNKAKEICEGNFTIKNTDSDKYGDIRGLHIQCTF